jgi:hypothetical protein
MGSLIFRGFHETLSELGDTFHLTCAALSVTFRGSQITPSLFHSFCIVCLTLPLSLDFNRLCYINKLFQQHRSSDASVNTIAYNKKRVVIGRDLLESTITRLLIINILNLATEATHPIFSLYEWTCEPL